MSPTAQAAHRQALRRDVVVIALALAAVLAWDFSGLDLMVMHAFGTAEGFAWRSAWWAERVLHDGAKLVSWGVLAALAVNVVRPWTKGPERAERLAWVLVTLACVVAVPALKRISTTSCPWDLQLFGGVAAYVPHWLPGARDGGPGHCFPSGHAVSAFGFVAGYFALRPYAPRAARVWLAGVVAAGLVLGATQTVRGAHPPSHTLWTAWLCWTLSWALWSAWAARRLRPAAVASPG